MSTHNSHIFTIYLCHPDRKPNDPERSRRGREVEWRNPDTLSRAHAASGTLVTNGKMCSIFNYSITKSRGTRAGPPRGRPTGLPSRVASARKSKATPGEAPGVGVFLRSDANTGVASQNMPSRASALKAAKPFPKSLR
jgi:hypothetical protein